MATAWAQNSKYWYMTIGAQTSPTITAQTTKPIARVDGDIMKTTEIVKNSSIQNIYNNASTIVEWNTTIEWSINEELSPIDSVRALYGVLWSIVSTDVSSALDSSVRRHVLTHGLCQLPPFSIESKLWGCGWGNSDPTGQTFMVSRAFGCHYDKMEISIEEWILKSSYDIKAYGAFDVAFLRTNESVEQASVAVTGATRATQKITFTVTAHGRAINDIVTIAGVTPSGYNGTYRITEVVNANSFRAEKTTNPGTYTSGGTMTKLSMFGFNAGGVKGLVIGDEVKLYEETTQTYEDVIVRYVDEVNDVLAFNSVLSTIFTVSNKTKVLLVQKTISYDTPQLFGFKNVKIRTGDTLLLAQAGEAYDANKMTISMENNIDTKFGTEFNTIKETGWNYMMDLGLLFRTLRIRDDFRLRKEQAMIIDIDNGTVISGTDTNNQTYKIRIEIPRFVYESWEVPTASESLLEESAAGLILHSFDEWYSIKVTVWNDKAGTYYTA